MGSGMIWFNAYQLSARNQFVTKDRRHKFYLPLQLSKGSRLVKSQVIHRYDLWRGTQGNTVPS
jgi:hypothetical protein